MDGKTESLFVDVTLPGMTLDEGLQIALDEALAKLPIPKLMSYQLADGWTSVHFVRPAHGLVALHGEQVVKAYALGLDRRPAHARAIASRPRARRSSCATPTATPRSCATRAR